MLGTRFLATAETSAAPVYKERIVRASCDDTVYTRLFDGGWPNAPHRALRNSTTQLAETHAPDVTGRRPGEGEVVAVTATGQPVPRYADTIPLPGMSGDLEALALYAGQSAGLVGDVPSVAEVVRRLVEQAAVVLADCVQAWADCGRGSGAASPDAVPKN
jgi:nitronate monooxygenase/enoyl-[acyl-carrier protein] reductase II